ncbi:hypothetical protein Patl1_27524 [Pistacia atlantica]|uniref:Uncharacterized protein n=1 Tax=Pistacia atlantica TaxID=434234 RepID=A0ACC1BF80_9ROSI|nr:hypothetical protein Patl1_27524 [Pistacia atlantica]
MAGSTHNSKNKRSHGSLPKHGYDGLKIPDAFVEHLNGSPKKVVL